MTHCWYRDICRHCKARRRVVEDYRRRKPGGFTAEHIVLAFRTQYATQPGIWGRQEPYCSPLLRPDATTTNGIGPGFTDLPWIGGWIA